MEQTVEMLDRLCQVLDRLIRAQQGGAPIEQTVLADYAEQLRIVAGQQAQLRESIARRWALLGQTTGDTH